MILAGVTPDCRGGSRGGGGPFGGPPNFIKREKTLRMCARKHCILELKAHIPLRTAFALGTQRRKKWDKQHEMYMANAKMLRWGPTATYIPLEMGFVLATQRE